MRATLCGGPHDGAELDVPGGWAINIPTDWLSSQSYYYRLTGEENECRQYEYIGVVTHDRP